MASPKQRGSRAIYVASSARELPEEVQDWLSYAGNRAGASPHIYDLLALLATGKRPDILIVSIEAVDWNELEFFDHVQRLSPETRIFVAGAVSHQAKIEAACARGASVFDLDSLNEVASESTEYAEPSAPAGLLAGSLRQESASTPASVRLPRKPKVVPAPPPEEPEPVEEQAPPLERPAVRLVTASESEVTESPVPFPWSPSPNRPQRKPPKSIAAELVAAESGFSPSTAPSPRDISPVKLTPEELAALLGTPVPPPPGSAQEKRS